MTEPFVQLDHHGVEAGVAVVHVISYVAEVLVRPSRVTGTGRRLIGGACK
jgi:hypothetical protein